MDINKVLKSKHPYKWRTIVRCYLPWFLIDLGFADKGINCEDVDAEHYWYNIDNKTNGCYYCKKIEKGQLWKK